MSRNKSSCAAPRRRAAVEPLAVKPGQFAHLHPDYSSEGSESPTSEAERINGLSPKAFADEAREAADVARVRGGDADLKRKGFGQ